VLLIKTDGNGNLQWAKTYGGTLDDSARAIVQTSDGGYIITGTTNSFGTGTYDIFLIKTDSSGNLLWARVYDGPADDVVSSVIEVMGKDIVVAGHTRSFGAGLHDFLLLKTDSLGNLRWVKTYGGSNEDWAYSVYEAYDHGYIIAGSTESFGAGLKDLLTVAQTKTNLSKSNRLPIRVLSLRVIPNPSARDYGILWL
jgi:TolB-like protein